VYTSFLACGIIAYYVVYDKVEWTVAVVTTSDVFFFSCRERHLIALRILFDKRGLTPYTSMYVPGADY